MTPVSGSQKGGTELTIKGSFFGKSIDNVKVKVGGVICQVTMVTHDTIKCTTGTSSGTTPELYPGMSRILGIMTEINLRFCM